jgi:hypothetical protein
MALQLHPDKDPSAASAQEFARACEAYDVLSSGEPHASSHCPAIASPAVQNAIAAWHAAPPDVPCRHRHSSQQSTGKLLPSCITAKRQATQAASCLPRSHVQGRVRPAWRGAAEEGRPRSVAQAAAGGPAQQHSACMHSLPAHTRRSWSWHACEACRRCSTDVRTDCLRQRPMAAAAAAARPWRHRWLAAAVSTWQAFSAQHQEQYTAWPQHSPCITPANAAGCEPTTPLHTVTLQTRRCRRTSSTPPPAPSRCSPASLARTTPTRPWEVGR